MGVITELAGPAALVVLDWPQRRNALGPDEANEVAAALRAAAGQPDVRGIVLTGNGAFCAGGDLGGMVARADMPPEERRALVYGAYQGLIRTLVELPVPTVAAVDGPAVGMGFDIALACDSRFIGPDGWLHTGDIGRVDESGRLTITGRLKDMFLVGGFNTYPAEIEQALAVHDAIAEVSVTGVPDARLGEVGMAFVVLRHGAEATPDELIAWAREHMANYKVPRQVMFVPAFPRNEAGKVMRDQLAKL